MSGPPIPSSYPQPRDGDIAIREEFAIAIVEGAPEALHLFMRRHPDHPLAEIARIILAREIFGPAPRQD